MNKEFLLKKIRCRFLDKKTNKPVKGVIASLSVLLGDNPNLTNLPIATLSSDATGYMSFDVKAIAEIDLKINTFLLTAPQYGLESYDLFASTKQTTEKPKLPLDPDNNFNDPITSRLIHSMHNTDMHELSSTEKIGQRHPDTDKSLCFVFPVYLDIIKEKSADCGCSDVIQQTLPSIQNPDTCDYKASPFSFVNPGSIKMGNDSCESITPSTLPLQQYHFYKIVVRDTDNSTQTLTVVKDGDSVSIDEPDNTDEGGSKTKIGSTGLSAALSAIDITKTLSQPTTQKIKLCEILDYKQSWFSLGHSLGEIKYSLPLAPGESTQLAVIEWSRQDSASRKDGVTATEFLDHDSRRERSIEDTVKAALSENQDGWSMMGGSSAAVSIPVVKGVDLSVNAAFGGGVSHSSGSRNVEGDSLQDLHDRVRQSSAYIRSLTSTVIVQSSQAESNTLQTRRVANHNHCHALTIQYYEVLRHYSLKTEYKGKRNAVLIPFSIFRFTEDIALRFRQAITPMLLDASLKDCFDALLRLKMPELYPTRYNTVIVKTNEHNPDAEIFPSGIFVKKGDVITMNGMGEIIFDSPNNSFRFSPDGLADKANSDYPCPGLNRFSMCFKIGNGPWQQAGSLVTSIADSEGEIFLISNDVKGTYADNRGSWTVNVMATTNGGVVQVLQGNTGNSETDAPSTITKTVEKSSTVYVVCRGFASVENNIFKSEISLKSGEKFALTASGFISMGSFATDPDGLGPNEKDEHRKYADTNEYPAINLLAYSLVYRIGDDGIWKQGGKVKSDLVAATDGNLQFAANDYHFEDNTGKWEVTVTTTKTIEVPADVKDPIINNPTTVNESNTDIVPAIKDKLCSLKLLTHLNSNQGYYNRIVWMMMDGVERRLYLENALKDLPEILNVMDDMPLAVTGNYIAFPCNLPGFALAASSANDLNKTQPSEYVEDIVCFPTRGLFAEAQLGHCNSCEERDITRMWDWNEMTTETPPDISGINPGPKGGATTLTPTQLPGNVIQIAQPQNAPDPTGLANALTLLGNGNAFRDMSGLNQVAGLLGQLSKESNESHIKAMAKMAQDKVNEMRNGGNQGSGGNGSNSQSSTVRQSPSERRDNLQMAEKTIDVLKKLGVPDDVIKKIATNSAENMDLFSGTSNLLADNSNSYPGSKAIRPPENSHGWLEKLIDWLSVLAKSAITSVPRSDIELSDALGDAVVEIAKDEIDNTIDAIPYGKAFRAALHYSLVFAEGVNAIIIASKKELQENIDNAAQFSQDNGLSEQDYNRIKTVRTYMAGAVAYTHEALVKGLELVVSDIIDNMKTGLIKSVQNLVGNITGAIVKKLATTFFVDSLFLEIGQEISKNVPAARRKLYNKAVQKLAGLMIYTFVHNEKQRTLLEGVLKNSSEDPAIGMLRSLLELGLSKKLYKELLSNVDRGSNSSFDPVTLSDLVKYECEKAANVILGELKEKGYQFLSQQTEFEIKVETGTKTIYLPSEERHNLYPHSPQPPENVVIGTLEEKFSTDEQALATVVDGLNIGVVLQSRFYQADINEGRLSFTDGENKAKKDAENATLALLEFKDALVDSYIDTPMEDQAKAQLIPGIISPVTLSGRPGLSIPNNYA